MVIRIRVKSSDFHVISDHLCHGLRSTTSIRRFWSYNDFIIIHGVRCDHGTGGGLWVSELWVGLLKLGGVRSHPLEWAGGGLVEGLGLGRGWFEIIIVLSVE